MQGSCLCGAIEVSSADQNQVEVCHCRMCRKWGGGPLLAVHCGADVTFSGKQKPTTYPSSEWAERGFCSTCGTHLFYHLLPADEYILPVGLFDEDSGFTISGQIFIDHKPPYYEFANETPTMTGEQVFAQFSDSNS